MSKIKLMKLVVPFMACWLIALSNPAEAQHYALYNSRTLYDSFENPSQSTFQIDTSRRYAFNFFIPTFGVNSHFSGPAESNFKALIYNGTFSGRDLALGQNERSRLNLYSNNYLGMFRILKKVKNSQELGASWQMRTEGQLAITNETFAIFDDYRLLTDDLNTDIFNNKGFSQTYHQFSLTYRQNLNKRFAAGLKGSLLSGIAYSRMEIAHSSLAIDRDEDVINVGLAGLLRSNFKYDNFERKMLMPDFKNPGLALSAGASYKARGGWFIMGNVKDLGFIHWNKNSYEYLFAFDDVLIGNASNSSADDRLADTLNKRIDRSVMNRGYVSLLNGKAEVLVNKDFGNYQPNLIISKNLFYNGGDIALVNNYRYRDLVATATGNYNTNGFLAVGAQFMVKSPNAEFFIGSDNVFKSAEVIRNSSNGTIPYEAGHTGASFYLGFGLKFGPVMEHQANANNIPGFPEKSERGFLRRLFGKKN